MTASKSRRQMPSGSERELAFLCFSPIRNGRVGAYECRQGQAREKVVPGLCQIPSWVHPFCSTPSLAPLSPLDPAPGPWGFFMTHRYLSARPSLHGPAMTSSESPAPSTQHPAPAPTFWVMLSSSSMSSLRTVRRGTGPGEARPPKQVRTTNRVSQSAMEPEQTEQEQEQTCRLA